MLTGGVAATAFTIVPRHVRVGRDLSRPARRLLWPASALGLRRSGRLAGILASPDVQIVAVCDVEKDGVNYREWGKNQIRNGIRRIIDNPNWREGSNHVPGGRDVGKEIVETYYAKQRRNERYRGCTTYVDLPRVA